MECRFIGIFKAGRLCGVSVSQFISLTKIESFGERDSRLKTKIRHFFFKIFGANVLILGNNMLTGQNAFVFTPDVMPADGLYVLHAAVEKIQKMHAAAGRKTHLTIFKDFYPSDASYFTAAGFSNYFTFSTQPNMVLTFRSTWDSFEDYLRSITKKYRDQYKRARKKSDGIEKRKLNLHEMEQYKSHIHELYLTVARNAPFNTFYLSNDHFTSLKRNLGEKFYFYGYFEKETLVGFSTLIANGAGIDTYFLGYDEQCQREKMLYLNMLYDMTAFSLNNRYRKVIFARTALEIKSSVGAVPQQMIGYMRHSNRLLDYFLPRLFRYFEPDTSWQQRHPFKD
jgi:hypothetical protein